MYDIDNINRSWNHKYICTTMLNSHIYCTQLIRGKQNLETVSRKLVLNRSADLIKEKSMLPLTNYRKAAKEIREIRLQWSEKMNESPLRPSEDRCCSRSILQTTCCRTRTKLVQPNITLEYTNA